MTIAGNEYWSSLLRRTLTGYDITLLRQVAAKLVRPRNQWPADELIDRAVATAENPAVIDRRLKELDRAGRQVLALIGHSRQPCWSVGNLVELLMALGHADGLQPLRELVEAGLIYPTSPIALASNDNSTPRIRSFEQWLASGGAEGLLLYTHPLIAARALGEDLGLPELSEATPPAGPHVHEADGLEVPLRLGLLWQQVAALPLRRTQQGGFFKRDHERLSEDPLLIGPAADEKVKVPDLGFLIAALAELEGILQADESELRAGELGPAWEKGLAGMLEALFADLPRLRSWNALDGWRGTDAPPGNPFASAGLLALLLLARLPADAWAAPADLEEWIASRHPFWASESMRPSRQKPWLASFLLGVAFPLRLLQTTAGPEEGWLVRLSPTGRWLLGLTKQPQLEVSFPQTLTVQPNLEIIAFRQGLTPGLIAHLSRFATWKSLGAACTLQLEPGSVYRALESGETFDSLRLVLERHATRALPSAVLDSLRTWADKRDRITIYPAAALLEFDSAADLNDAFARGLLAERIADHMAVVASESAVDYRHFRLTGTRDYSLPPDKCATVEPDGVTIVVDATRSDLMLETELPRFAEAITGPPGAGRRYRLTPASLTRARNTGMMPTTLEAWFQQRCGQPMPPAAQLLMMAGQTPPVEFRRHLVLHVATEEIADGLEQWPETRGLIAERLGPTALGVAEQNRGALRERLAELGIATTEEQSAAG